jgi:hypothetical protein
MGQNRPSRQAERTPKGGQCAPAYHDGAAAKRSPAQGLRRGILLSHRGYAGDRPGKVRGAGPHPSGGVMCRHRGAVTRWCFEAATGFRCTTVASGWSCSMGRGCRR